MKSSNDIIRASARLGTAVRTSNDPAAIEKARIELHMIRLEIAIENALVAGVRPGSVGTLTKKLAAAVKGV